MCGAGIPFCRGKGDGLSWVCPGPVGSGDGSRLHSGVAWEGTGWIS